ncbi:MAG: fumarylacetoacetate hydrolase family protein [Myxococcales bacterium FL481]|nr:MAG: fumarylacetoacetate hydrolase family protein [Myxococcales bacterium FL481]
MVTAGSGPAGSRPSCRSSHASIVDRAPGLQSVVAKQWPTHRGAASKRPRAAQGVHHVASMTNVVWANESSHDDSWWSPRVLGPKARVNACTVRAHGPCRCRPRRRYAKGTTTTRLLPIWARGTLQIGPAASSVTTMSSPCEVSRSEASSVARWPAPCSRQASPIARCTQGVGDAVPRGGPLIVTTQNGRRLGAVAMAARTTRLAVAAGRRGSRAATWSWGLTGGSILAQATGAARLPARRRWGRLRAMSKEKDDRILWIGQLIAPGEEGPKTVRVWTEGGAPGPDSRFEEIADPFVDSSSEPTVWMRANRPALPGGVSGHVGETRLAPPVRARKVLGIGRNYRAHAAELGNDVPQTPLLFLKPGTCLLADGAGLALPRGYERIDMEAELVVVIGSRAKSIEPADAWHHVAGYCLGNDVSCRDLQRADKQWTRAKGFDGFGPLGPFIRLTPPGFRPPVEQMKIVGYLDDTLVQRGAIDDMVFDIPTLLAHITACMTLEPGDLIYTGTPAGVSPLTPGACTAVGMEGFELGRLANRVV